MKETSVSQLDHTDTIIFTMPDGGTVVGTLAATVDSAGNLFLPDSCSHAYTYDGSGNILTDTATEGAIQRVKTYTWTSGNLATESLWVVQ